MSERLKYGTPGAPLVECKLHGHHPSDEECPWCEPQQTATTWEEMIALQDDGGVFCAYCNKITTPGYGNVRFCRGCWAPY